MGRKKEDDPAPGRDADTSDKTPFLRAIKREFGILLEDLQRTSGRAQHGPKGVITPESTLGQVMPNKVANQGQR
jgi:hypothetical protein